MSIDNGRPYTAEEVREMLGISVAHLNNLRDLGFLHPIRLGQGWKYPRVDFQIFLHKYGGQDLSNYEKLLEVKRNETNQERDSDLFSSAISKCFS